MSDYHDMQNELQGHNQFHSALSSLKTQQLTGETNAALGGIRSALDQQAAAIEKEKVYNNALFRVSQDLHDLEQKISHTQSRPQPTVNLCMEYIILKTACEDLGLFGQENYSTLEFKKLSHETSNHLKTLGNVILSRFPDAYNRAKEEINEEYRRDDEARQAMLEQQRREQRAGKIQENVITGIVFIVIIGGIWWFFFRGDPSEGGNPNGGGQGGGFGGAPQPQQPTFNPSLPAGKKQVWTKAKITTAWKGKSAAELIKSFGNPANHKQQGNLIVYFYDNMYVKEKNMKYSKVSFAIQPDGKGGGSVFAIGLVPNSATRIQPAGGQGGFPGQGGGFPGQGGGFPGGAPGDGEDTGGGGPPGGFPGGGQGGAPPGGKRPR
jgi:hypothetical protein